MSANDKRIHKLVDAIMSTKALLVLGLIIGLLSAYRHWWDWIEPTTGVVTLALAAATWWQTRKAAKARYNDCTGENFYMVVQFKRTVVQAMTEHFGRAPDHVILVKDLVGTTELTSPDHWEMVAKAAYQAMAAHQHKNIHFLSDGPGQLWAILGQMVGMDRLRVNWCGYFGGKVDLGCPRPRGDWMA